MSDADKIRFDWRQVRQRVDAAFARLGGEDLSAADIQRLLKERAQALAEVPSAIEEQDTLEILEFLLAHERYAIETAFIREIRPLDNLTPIPGTPGFVMGIVNIRGEILSVLDIKRFFGLPEKGITHLDKLIVLESGAMLFAILADELVGVRPLPCSELDSSRQAPAGIDGSYIRGITSSGLAVLDAQALLDDDKIIVQ